MNRYSLFSEGEREYFNLLNYVFYYKRNVN